MASTSSYALSLVWPTLSGSTSDKIAQINATAVAGPNVDVSISQVAGFLLLQGVYPTIASFALGSPSGNATHDGALQAAKTFVAWIALQGAPPVHMSLPEVYTAVNTMADTVMAQEVASPGSTGFTQAVRDGLLALAQTTIPWWQANGFVAPVTSVDVANAGLT